MLGLDGPQEAVACRNRQLSDAQCAEAGKDGPVDGIAVLLNRPQRFALALEVARPPGDQQCHSTVWGEFRPMIGVDAVS